MTTWLPTCNPNRLSLGAMGRGGGHSLKKIDNDASKAFHSAQVLANATWRQEAKHLEEFDAQLSTAGNHGTIQFGTFRTAIIDYVNKRQIGAMDVALEVVQEKARSINEGIQVLIQADVSMEFTSGEWKQQLLTLIKKTMSCQPEDIPVE